MKHHSLGTVVCSLIILMLCESRLPSASVTESFLQSQVYEYGNTYGYLNMANYNGRKIEQIYLSLSGYAYFDTSQSPVGQVYFYVDIGGQSLSAPNSGYLWGDSIDGNAYIILEKLKCDDDGDWWAEKITFGGTSVMPDFPPPILYNVNLGQSPMAYSTWFEGSPVSMAYLTIIAQITHSPFPVPSYALSVPASVDTGQNLSVSINVTAPDGINDYYTGYMLLESRKDTNGNPLPGGEEWITVETVQPDGATRNRQVTLSRPPMSQPGNVTYRLFGFNQLMTNEQRWAVTPDEKTVAINNHSPTCSWTPNTAQTIQYGQSLVFASTAGDQDQNLQDHVFDVRTPANLWNWQAGAQSWWSGDRRGYSLAGMTGTSTISGTIHPHRLAGNPLGQWRVGFNARDHANADWVYQDAGNQYTAVTVVKSAPQCTYNSKSMSAYETISNAQLDAAFRNQYDPTVVLTGTVTYALNGTSVSAGQNIAAGTYTLCAAYTGDTYHLAASATTTLTVMDDPDGDNDSDGIPNRIEAKLGTVPGTPWEIINDNLEIKILTPVPTED
jgi:hypothetical protein